MAKVLEYILRELEEGPLHFSLIDPDKQTPELAVKKVAELERLGTHAIMIGGSSSDRISGHNETAKALRESSTKPKILFPWGWQAFTPYVDAIFWMSLFNSMDPYYIIGTQAKACRYMVKLGRRLEDLGIEPLPMAYLIVEPGMRVAEIGKVATIKRRDYDRAVELAMNAEYFGMKLVYLETGSGSPLTVPEAMIKHVKRNVNIPVIVGGGIYDRSSARDLIRAGADIIVTGTLIEKSENMRRGVKPVIDAVGSARETGRLAKCP